ncbi:MAG: nitroreductase family protein [Candidatus Omnitrophica bacterium]|nr:nitroreductase family protein [Candidatus Omnitrophota bacterium]MCM8798930.1 nitroreductase family protein [Candidatus Omnitrophota bacterium]
MEVMEAIKKRRSIRSYLDKPVEEEKLKRILEAGRLAPSAKNLQEWRFIIVRDKTTREKIMQAAKGQRFVSEAPVVIVACAVNTDYKMTCGQYAYPIDVAIALAQISLKAVEEGLGTCWIGAFYEDKVKEILAIPNEVRVVELMTLGYPKGIPQPTERKKWEEIVCYEKWKF